MLKLSLTQREPAWLDLIPDVRLRVRPPTSAAMIAARTAASKAFQPPEEGAPAPSGDRGSEAAASLVLALAHHAIVEWEGVGDAEGEPAPVTAENVEALMRVWPAFDAFDRLYVAPALAGSEEKNG